MIPGPVSASSPRGPSPGVRRTRGERCLRASDGKDPDGRVSAARTRAKHEPSDGGSAPEFPPEPRPSVLNKLKLFLYSAVAYGGAVSGGAELPRSRGTRLRGTWRRTLENGGCKDGILRDEGEG